MAIELGRVKIDDLVENNYKVLGIGVNTSSNNNGIFETNYTTLSQAKFNLINLILTRKGERIMQPDFGCDVWECVFEPINNEILETKIEDSVLDAVSKWLPYITVDEIVFDYDDNDIDNNKIILDIKFSLSSNRNIGDSVTINI
jgi:phage baseplate assembly protein W